jgi:predicted transcriptional regulator
LSNLLSDQYGIVVEFFDEKDYPVLGSIRSVFIPKSKKLLINKRISSDQRAFTLARELGFLHMNLKMRPMTSSWIEVNSFDEVFNNFQASYFAGAILIKKEPLVQSLKHFFSSEKFSEKKLIEIIHKFQTTPETLLHRIFSILPHFFDIDKLFFLRFEAPMGSKDYVLTKELHLSKLHDPQESKNENYCRRWVSLKILDELSSLQKSKKDDLLVQAQVSDYEDAGNQYFVISIARPLNILESTNVSVSIGFEVSLEVIQKIAFLNDSKVKHQKVNQTCEKCSIFDCKERVAAPTILQKKRQTKMMKEAIASLN